ncbi:MAG: hypothetical protein KJO09_15715 [Gammaproteobacteria bacterium]|nr:hypothetical protein [Gammaproteobacteria bacterium]
MLLKLLRFELGFHTRQNIFVVATLVYFLMGIVVTQGGPANTISNSPFAVTYLINIFTIGSVIVIALLAGVAILRDSEHKMDGIIFTTGLSRQDYVISRFGGLVLAAMAVLAAAALGLYVGRFMPWVDATEFRGYSVGPYLWALLFIGLPNVLVGCSVIFAAAALSRNSMATYLSGVLLYVLYFVGSIIGNSPLLAGSNLEASTNPELAALLEPYGLVAFMEQTRYWAVAQKNEAYAALEGMFFYNRVLWTGFALSLLALTYRFFDFRVLRKEGGKPKSILQAAFTPITYRPISPVPTGIARGWTSFLMQARMDLKTVVRGFPFYALMLLWTMLVLIMFKETLVNGEMGNPRQPLTHFLVAALIMPLQKIGSFVVIFFAAELLFIERSNKMDGILDATPISNLSLAGAKVLSASLVILILIGYSIVLGVGTQLFLDAPSINLALYASLFLRVGIPLLAMAVLCVCICNFFTNKYMGMALSFLVMVLFSGFSQVALMQHPMLQFAYIPAFSYSTMADTTYHAAFTNSLLVFWTGLAGVLLSFALRYWRRGPEKRPSAFSMSTRALAALSLFVLVTSGSYAAYQFHANQEYRTKKERIQYKADYERAYTTYEDQRAPTYSDMNLSVDIYPQERTYRVRGSLAFINNTDQPIEELLVGFSSLASKHQVDIDGATLLEQDPTFDHYLFRFNEPLLPGQRGQLETEVEVLRSAFMRRDGENFVLPNASYIEVDKVLPFFGFNENNLLQDPKNRAKYDLPPRSIYPSQDDHISEDGGWVNLDVTLSGQEGQELLMPGKLVRSWQEDGRHHASYRSKGLVRPRFAVAAGTYETRTAQADGVTVTAYYSKGQDGVVDALLQGAVDTLRYGSRVLVPYDDDELKIVAIPSFADRVAGTAYRNTIFEVENRIYQLEPKKGGNFNAYRGMAHEVGHQWWGHTVHPANAEGHSMIAEMLAVYTETVMSDEVYGMERRMEELKRRRDLYFYIRSFEEDVERPMYEVHYQPYIYYFKGAHVAYVLSQLMGRERVDQVLGQFAKTYRYPARPTADKLSKALISAAPEQYRDQVRELLEEVVTYNLRMISAKGTKEGTVLVAMQADRIVWDETGNATETAFTGPLELGFYKQGELIGSQMIDLKTGASQHEVFPPQGTDRVGLDPQMLRLDDDSDNNRISVTAL